MATSAANTIQPLADRVVVQAAEETEQTRGGLYIPDTAQKEKPQQGTVVAVGPGRLTDDGKRVAPDVSAGDSILYGKYSGTEVTVDDEEYLILRESDILAIIND
jgi:chaperonin GroES